MRAESIVIVGAGHAGLAAASALHKMGRNPVVLEEGDTVGTSWRRRHDRLTLNTVRRFSGLPGARIPRAEGRWVSRDGYVAYLDRYARDQGIEVEFGVKAERISRVGARWRIDTDGDELVARHVIVATGHDHIPWSPDWPGRDSFQVPILHAAELASLSDLVGQRILLVGGGNSGVELAGRLADIGAERLWLSIRTPPVILPRELHGVPLHAVTVATRGLPEAMRDAIARAIARRAIGDLAPYGLPQATDGPFRHMRLTGRTVAIDTGFVEHLVGGRVTPVAAIDRLDGPHVLLQDGTRLTPDVVVTATGYRTGLSALLDAPGVVDDRGRPRTTPGRPAADGLWFIGYWPAIEGDLRQHPRQARWIADRIVSGRRHA